MPLKSTLRALAELILKNVDVLEASCEAQGLDVPNLDDPFNPATDFKRDDAGVHKATGIIIAAANQLVQTVRPPQVNLVLSTFGCVVSAACRTASEMFIAEALHEAGSQGLHINDIAAKCKTDPLKLGPVMRLLASHFIFREVKPDIFANNRTSSILYKGFTIDELQKNPELKYTKPEGAVSAMACLFAEDVAKPSTVLYETLSDPATAFSSEPNECATSRYFNTTMPIWEFMEQPDQAARLHRFGVAMEGVKMMDPPELAIKGYDWSTVKDGSIVVDVGGGVGTLSLALAKEQPRLKLVVQDRPPVAEEGVKRWQGHESVKAEIVSFQGHNFFDPQPVKNASVFMLRFILHDWADSYALKILQRLREAATPQTRLLVLDKIMPYTCPPTAEALGDSLNVPGVLKPELPSPISNMSSGNTFPHMSNLTMVMFANGQERTLGHFSRLLESAGWKISKVHQFEALGDMSSQITAEPI